jgi:hypothetical protein
VAWSVFVARAAIVASVPMRAPSAGSAQAEILAEIGAEPERVSSGGE